MSAKSTNRFDEMIRNTVAEHRAPYEPAQWWDMEKRLDRLGKIRRLMKLGAGFGIALLAVIGSWYFVGHEKDPVAPAIEYGGTPLQDQSNDAAQRSTDPVAIESHEEYGPVDVQAFPEDLPRESTDEQPSESSKQNPDVVPAQVSKDSSHPVQAYAPPPNTGSSGVALNHPDFAISSSTICAGNPVKFTALMVPAGCTVEWLFGDGMRGEGMTCAHTYSTEGVYDVEMLIRNASGTTNSKLSKEAVVVLAAPEANFTFNVNDVARNTFPMVIFENTSFGHTSASWIFGDGETSLDPNPQHLYVNKGTYRAGLVVSNAAGCSDTIYKSVLIKSDYNLLAPNSFSPNGDGINDTWIPLALQYGDFTFTLNIIDRSSGKIIFSTTDAAHQWDGQLGNSNGKAQPGSVFGWIAILKDKNGKARKYTGSITVL